MEKATSWSYTEKQNYKFFPPSHGPVQDSASSWKILIQPPVRVVEQHLLQVGKIGSFRGKNKKWMNMDCFRSVQTSWSLMIMNSIWFLYTTWQRLDLKTWMKWTLSKLRETAGKFVWRICEFRLDDPGGFDYCWHAIGIGFCKFGFRVADRFMSWKTVVLCCVMLCPSRHIKATCKCNIQFYSTGCKRVSIDMVDVAFGLGRLAKSNAI